MKQLIFCTAMEEDLAQFSCLKYLENIQTSYNDLLNNNKYSDVTLVSDDHTVFKCHKVILSAASPAMDELLNVVGHQTLAIYMRGINQADLTSVLELIYKGETRVSSTNVSHFLSVAKELKLVDTYDSDNSKNEFEKEYSGIEESVMEPNEKVNICDETQNTSEKYVQYVSQSDETNSKFYYCGKCDFKSVHKHNVKVHDYNLHTGSPTSCEQCEYSTTRKDVMTKHIQAMHEGIKIKCHQCDYKASTRSTLNYHIRIKHEGLAFPCTDCPYHATSTSSLRNHKERVHDKKTHPCNICDFQATDRGYLKKHIESMHHGKTFSCEYCSHITRFRSSLLKHVQQVHKLMNLT